MGDDVHSGHEGVPPEPWPEPFRRALGLHGRPESRVKWYFVWARRFAASLSDKSMRLATREDAEGFLSTLASSPGVAAWQLDQAADALKILLGSVFGQAWAREIRAPADRGPGRERPEGPGDRPPRALEGSARCPSRRGPQDPRPGPGGRLCGGDLLARPRAQVPGRSEGMGVAIRFSRLAPLRRTRDRQDPSAPHARECPPESCPGRRASSGHRKAGRMPHAAALLRHAPAGVGIRHPHGAGIARAQRRLDHHDLHTRAEPAGIGGEKPGGRVVGGR